MREGFPLRDEALLFCLVLSLYLCFPSSLHFFDGVACSIAVELADPKNLLHGNHLIYGMAGLLFHRLLWTLGAKLSALSSLQLLDSTLGALGAAFLYNTLRRLGFSQRASWLCGLGLAASQAYWLWSLEANVYILGTLFLLLTVREALAQRPRANILALWHGLAMITHGANVLLAPAVLWRLRAGSGQPRKDLLRYLLCAALIVFCAYALALLLFIRPANPAQLRIWLLGSAALTPDRSFEWLGGKGFTLAQRLSEWLRASGRSVCALPWLALPVWSAALLAPRLAEDARRRDAAVCGWLWLGAYALLFFWWQPFNIVYRASDMPALWLLAAPAMERLERKKALPSAALLILIVFAVNLQKTILPNNRPKNNALLQEAYAIAAQVPEDAWVSAESDEEVYWPYFAHRRPLNLRHYRGREAALEEFIRARQREGQPVYVTERSLARGWASVFGRMGLEKAAQLERTALYRVKGGVRG